ncbi:MAG: sialidase family protein [Verrucomicrobiota bacterium]|nr:sialidase family protein [Verrucomicrobiota bacterium]
MNTLEILSRGIVYSNPEPHLKSRQAFHPAIINLGNGELLCSFDIGEAVESLDYRTYQARSLDNGEMWEFEGPLLKYESEIPTSHTMRISKVKDGLVGFGSLVYRKDPKQGILNRENLGYAEMDLILGRSNDKGKTWSGPEIISPPLVGPAFEICHSIVELSDGRWLAPTSTWRGWDGELPNGEKGLVLISDDQGKTWPEYGVTFDGGPENGDIHWEQSVFSWQDAIIAISWYFDSIKQEHRPNRFSVSRDNGRTFSPSDEIGIKGQTCKALNVDDERILLAYRRVDKPGLWLGLYDFDGKSWELLHEKPCWGVTLKDSGMTGEGTGSDELSALPFGFPQMTKLDDGTILMLFWGLEGWSSSIKWVKIKV